MFFMFSANDILMIIDGWPMHFMITVYLFTSLILSKLSEVNSFCPNVFYMIVEYFITVAIHMKNVFQFRNVFMKCKSVVTNN